MDIYVIMKLKIFIWKNSNFVEMEFPSPILESSKKNMLRTIFYCLRGKKKTPEKILKSKPINIQGRCDRAVCGQTSGCRQTLLSREGISNKLYRSLQKYFFSR